MDTTDSSVASLRGRVAIAMVTQERLAQVVGVNHSTISRLLSGSRSPHRGLIARIHRALDAIEEAEAAAETARREVLDRHEREWERERQQRLKELEHAVGHRSALHSAHNERPKGNGEVRTPAKVAS